MLWNSHLIALASTLLVAACDVPTSTLPHMHHQAIIAAAADAPLLGLLKQVRRERRDRRFGPVTRPLRTARLPALS
jgi:uncharacterized lipoprotein YajG